MSPRVAVLGAAGRMGATVCEAVERDPDLDLVARIGRGDALEGILEAHASVAVDFTVPDAVRSNVEFCLANGVHAVVGTSGLGAADLDALRAAAERSSANALVAPNFALGAVLMMSFAAQAARHLRHVEIVERHHERKLDAPSGTALRTAHLIGEARAEPVGQGDEDAPAARGARVDDVPIHSLRLPGSVAHQEVVFGGPGEILTIRHDSLDRASFMPGVLLAIKRVHERPGLTVGLEALLGA